MKKKWSVLVVLALFVFQGMALFSADEPPKKVAKLLKKAEKALSNKEADKALESYNQALELAPEYGPVHLGIARVLMLQNKSDEAVASLDKALQYDPDSATTKTVYAKTLSALGKNAISQRMYQKATGYYEKVVAVPGIDTMDKGLYASALFELGRNYAGVKKFAKSNEAYDKLLSIPEIESTNPKEAFEAYYQAGYNAYQLQQYKESVDYFNKLFAMPGADMQNVQIYATSHYLAGISASMLEDFDNSNKLMEKFLGMPVKPEQLVGLANFIMGSNHMKVLEAEVQKIRKDDSVKDKIEKTKELADSKPEIETLLNKAIELQDTLEPAYMNLGNYYYYSGNMEKAISTYKTLIEKFSTSPDIESYKTFLADLEKKAEKK
jgi:tetratricopeptide (TPR) repeat protein